MSAVKPEQDSDDESSRSVSTKPEEPNISSPSLSAVSPGTVADQGTPARTIKQESKENFTPEDDDDSDGWKGAQWTPADVSTLEMRMLITTAVTTHSLTIL
jgi:hypothetical protein